MSHPRIFTQSQLANLSFGEECTHCIFDGLDLKRLVQEDCTFLNCSFKDCDLKNSRWNGSTLRGCDMSNASVAGANFFATTFVECKLLGWALSEAHSIVGATFTKCVFDYGNLRALNLSDLDLSGSSCMETDLSLCDLSRTNLTNSRLINVKLDGAKFEQTDLRGAELQGINIAEANLRGIIITPEQAIGLVEATGVRVVEGSNPEI